MTKPTGKGPFGSHAVAIAYLEWVDVYSDKVHRTSIWNSTLMWANRARLRELLNRPDIVQARIISFRGRHMYPRLTAKQRKSQIWHAHTDPAVERAKAKGRLDTVPVDDLKHR